MLPPPRLIRVMFAANYGAQFITGGILGKSEHPSIYLILRPTSSRSMYTMTSREGQRQGEDLEGIGGAFYV